MAPTYVIGILTTTLRCGIPCSGMSCACRKCGVGDQYWVCQYVSVLCCGLYTFLFNMVHVCFLHGQLWSAVLVCVKCGLCIGCGYANQHKVLWWVELAKWHKM